MDQAEAGARLRRRPVARTAALATQHFPEQMERACVVEWLPHTATRSTDVKNTPAFLPSWNFARFSSSRVSAWKFAFGMLGALAAAMSAFVLHGLPTTITLHVFLAT
jgi:hypothetical protein